MLAVLCGGTVAIGAVGYAVGCTASITMMSVALRKKRCCFAGSLIVTVLLTSQRGDKENIEADEGQEHENTQKADHSPDDMPLVAVACLCVDYNVIGEETDLQDHGKDPCRQLSRSWRWAGVDQRDEKQRESNRVRPRFNSTRYGKPDYCQLANDCAGEIKRGADDESEMGVFHDLFQPQRAANLRARLDEFTPAGMEAGIIYAS